MTRRPRHFPSIPRLTIAALVMVVGVVTAMTAQAGSVTNGAGQPPFTETAVYQGVIAVIPGGIGDSLLEIGNQGKDIASTGDIYLRPHSLTGANTGVRVTKNGNSGITDLHVYGRLCLAGQCEHTWPSAGGTSFWTQTSTWLEPSTAGQGLYTASSGVGFGGYGLEVYGDHSDAALYISKQTAGGTALQSASSVEIRGSLNVTGQMTMLDCPPGGNCPDLASMSVGRIWEPANDGRASGLDAARIDGFNFRVLRTPYDASACGTGGSGQWCVCGEFEGFGVYDCLNLP